MNKFNFKQGSCLFDRNKRVAQITGYKFLPENDENELTKAIATIGVIFLNKNWLLLLLFKLF